MKHSESLAGENRQQDAMALFEKLVQGPLHDRVSPVMTKTLSLRPDIYSAVMAAGKPILFEGELPVSVKQMIVMIIATGRESRFCADVHRTLLQAMGIDDSLIDNCINDPEMKLVPPMYRQVLQFALDAARDPNAVDDAQFDRLRDSGLNEAEILEIAMVTSYANFLVTWTDVPIDFDA